MSEQLAKPGLQTASGNLAKTKAPVYKSPTLVNEPTSTSTSTPKKPKKQTSYFKPVAAKATSTQANRQILVAVGAGIGVILLARVSGTPGVQRLNDPGDLLKIAVGTGATIIALMVMAEVAPDLAIALAWLICIGAVLGYGVDFARAVAKGTLNPGVPLTPLGPGIEKGVGSFSGKEKGVGSFGQSGWDQLLGR